jgi:mannose-1-phosphate guanylyltransferase / mannose-6-phosphate isomerase
VKLIRSSSSACSGRRRCSKPQPGGPDPTQFEPLIVVANAEHRFAVGEQLQATGVRGARIVLESFGRNTAPAAAVAALISLQTNPDAILLIMPADHHIADGAGFLAAIASGMAAVARGKLVLFGVRAKSPATGYGYIRLGAPVPDATG